MNVIFETKSSDYDTGSVKLIASNKHEAFLLGRLFEEIFATDHKAVCADIDENIWIRVPLSKKDQS